MLLEAQTIGYRYNNGPWLLRGVTMSLEPGEVTGLIGPSGYGKTTLARILSGYEQPQEGSITLDGLLLPGTGYGPVQLVLQHPEKAINPRWRMSSILNEGGKPDAEIITALGIEETWLNRWPNELSGGELQRFCLARALTSQTRFLIADEMTTMLDAITQAQIWHVVLEYVRTNNLGVLVVSHELKLLQQVCNRIIDLASLNQS